MGTADFDLVVIGGGMAGMSAAAEAAGQGARVAVCEASDRVGGTALLSTGNVWTVQTDEAFRAADPDGDTELWQIVRDHMDDSLDWVASLGVPVRERHKSSSSSTYDPPPIGRNIDIETFMVRSRRAVERSGGWVLNGTTVSKLQTRGEAVEGAIIETVATGERLNVGSRGVLLASGGFQANADLRARYLGKVVAESVAVRSNLHSQGTGLRLGLQVGASPTPRMDTFYGVIVPAIPGVLSEGDYRGVVIHGAVYGVALGSDGRRFIDESVGAVPLANALARARRALLVVGPDTNATAVDRLGMGLMDLMRTAQSRGARCALDLTTESLATTVSEWGYDGVAAKATLAEFDEAMQLDAVIAPARKRHHIAIGTGPIAVLEVKTAMTSTFGGIQTDIHGQALDRVGSPVPGLFAAGVDQGGYNVSGYVGGLSRALVFGRRAARKALDL